MKSSSSVISIRILTKFLKDRAVKTKGRPNLRGVSEQKSKLALLDRDWERLGKIADTLKHEDVNCSAGQVGAAILNLALDVIENSAEQARERKIDLVAGSESWHHTITALIHKYVEAKDLSVREELFVKHGLYDLLRDYTHAVYPRLENTIYDHTELLHRVLLTLEDRVQSNKKLLSFKNREAFKKYLKTSIKNVLIDEKRNKDRQQKLLEMNKGTIMDLFGSHSNPMDMIDPFQMEKITEILNSLPEKTREIWELHNLSDLNDNQIVELLGIKSETIRRHLRIARQALFDGLKETNE